MKFVWCLVCGSALVLVSCLISSSWGVPARGGIGYGDSNSYTHAAHAQAQRDRHQSHQMQDQVPAATGHHHHTGRVQIKVYRGQSKGHGWDHFAPYGYWVRQPADDHHHGWSS